MVNSLTFKIDGLDVTVHSPAEDVELKKSRLPTSLCYFRCKCKQGDVKITKDVLKLAVKLGTKMEGSLHVAFDGVLRAKQRAQAFVNAQKEKSFTAYAREAQKADNMIVGEYFDAISTVQLVTCGFCERDYNIHFDVENPIKPKEYADWLEILEAYPLKKDSFTLEVLSRLAYVQGFGTSENLVDYCNSIYEDFKSFDEKIGKISKILDECNLASECGKNWLQDMRSRLTPISDDVKKELKKELFGRLQQIWESSPVTLLPEEEKEAEGAAEEWEVKAEPAI